MRSSRTLLPSCSRTCTSARHRALQHFHTSASTSILQQKLPSSRGSTARPPVSSSRTQPPPSTSAKTTSQPQEPTVDLAVEDPRYAVRNDLGVQLLSRSLHRQIFKQTAFPSPPNEFVQIAKDHLATHGLDPAQGSVLPTTSFTLPPLQGPNLSEHFHRLGASTAQPWLSLANTLAEAPISDPPAEEGWSLASGWTKYYPDGCHHHVAYPGADADGQGPGENMLVFDVETLPKVSPYPIMACAATPSGWYAWISPWLVGESDSPAHLVPLGPSSAHRVVVGHNVSYDRARVREEYALPGTHTRFLDTMALHVAVRGISSHQRPAWLAHRRRKEEAAAQADEAREAVRALVEAAQAQEEAGEVDEVRREALRRMREELEESLARAEKEAGAAVGEEVGGGDVEGEGGGWEDLTSANSLADVARLHCGIEMDKSTRDDFMVRSREEIRDGLREYLAYCAEDVRVTHAVYAQVLPAFRAACPSPVSFAGVLTMGSAFLPVNEEWEKYVESAERTYRELDEKVKRRLVDLAREAKEMMDSGAWNQDPWLSQLDWEPKVAGASRGVVLSPPATATSETATTTLAVAPILPTSPPPVTTQTVPKWYQTIAKDPLSTEVIRRILPYMLHASYDGRPLQYDPKLGWHYLDANGAPMSLPTAQTSKVINIWGRSHGRPALASGKFLCDDKPLAESLIEGNLRVEEANRIVACAGRLLKVAPAQYEDDPSWSKLDWKPIAVVSPGASSSIATKVIKPPKPPKPAPVHWPKWYWELTKPKKGLPPGTIDLTVRNSVSPLLLKLAWQKWPLFRSREHGWIFRVPRSEPFETRAKLVNFADEADAFLAEQAHGPDGTGDGEYAFYKLPHKDGDAANVGSPLAKTFIKYAQDGTLTSPSDAAKDALDMNAQCSYWISARDRVLNQLVLWQSGAAGGMGYPAASGAHKWGMIVPQVITMGTVTRRAIEKTWLTASNAKKNRVGSELKAMVRAPPGYAIVGADVDSEELWISSLMGDAQFGMHGATAIGWMTLEGTKAAGTDLHSKTASILGISRDQAKVFNYSRIYGAGMRHAVLLLLQANAGMLPDKAQELAGALYAQTKGKNTHTERFFGRKFWHGGTESFVFNKLEAIALSDSPQTPALQCGVTHALAKAHLKPGFGTDYMTSRINWVVQSSGVDYLHMLIVAMDHLTRTYDIKARYLISVHDEVRYLVAEGDRYRAALAMQIANLWTRAMFAYKLGFDDLPQGVAFFSAVDVDKVLRKEVDMPCVTPSQPVPLPPGESLGIEQAVERTNGGSLWPDGRPMSEDARTLVGDLDGYEEPDCLKHRAASKEFLRAQATTETNEIRMLAKLAGEFRDTTKNSSSQAATKARQKWTKTLLGNGEEMDIEKAVDEYIKAEAWRRRDALRA